MSILPYFNLEDCSRCLSVHSVMTKKCFNTLQAALRDCAQLFGFCWAAGRQCLSPLASDISLGRTQVAETPPHARGDTMNVLRSQLFSGTNDAVDMDRNCVRRTIESRRAAAAVGLPLLSVQVFESR